MGSNQVESAAADPWRVVAWQWHDGQEQFISAQTKTHRLVNNDVFAKSCAIPLVRESLLAEAERELADHKFAAATLNTTLMEVAAQRDALQAQVDAVRAWVDSTLNSSPTTYTPEKGIASMIRAALGETR